MVDDEPIVNESESDEETGTATRPEDSKQDLEVTGDQGADVQGGVKDSHDKYG